MSLFRFSRKDSNKNSTALIAAAFRGDADKVRKLLELGIDVNAKNKDGTTALMWAALKGNKYIVKALLKKRARINEKNKDGSTALMWAVDNGNKYIVEALLDKGADFKSRNNYGATALSCAVDKGNKAVVQTLLEKGAAIDEKNRNAGAALNNVLMKEDKNVTRNRARNKKNVMFGNDLSKVPGCKNRDESKNKMLDSMFSMGVDANEKGRSGTTVLMWAALKGNMGDRKREQIDCRSAD